MTLIVFSVFVYSIMKTSGQFKCASIMIKNILSMNGPKKSTCTRSHGEVGHPRGCNNALVGSFDNHCIAMSLSMPGQNT